jgi:CD2 antigen cytoplasmic tail-binding protein 2
VLIEYTLTTCASISNSHRRPFFKSKTNFAERSTDDTQRGKSLEELEHEEGGPIKESLVGMAQTKRAAKRKGGPLSAVADTDLVDDVQRIEEELEVEEEDGIKLEAFNLIEERQKGYFDDAGNYVENEKDEEGDATDAWLASDEAKTVDAATLEKIKEQERQLAEAEEAAPLTAVQLARLQWQISKILKPGETVAGGLKRLGGALGQHRRPIGKRANKRNKPESISETQAQLPDPKDKEQFDQLTEAASALVDSGETEVYGQEKSYFERAAAVYIDIDEGPSTLLAQGVGTVAYEDADEDMFADEDEEEKPGKVEEGEKKEEEKETTAGKEKEEEEEDKTDYASWPIKELRRFLQERGVDPSGIVEKGELVAKVKETAEKSGNKAENLTTGKNAQAPAGYAFDPSSGMWYSAESAMYWDSNSGGFYNPASEKWYSFSEKGEWVEWPSTGTT